MYTLDTFLTSVRELLKDEDAQNYRYSDASLIRTFNYGVAVLRDRRPDAFVVKEGFTELTESDRDSQLQIPIIFRTPMIYFVVGFTELRDDEFTDDARAVTLISKFESEVGARSVQG